MMDIYVNDLLELHDGELHLFGGSWSYIIYYQETHFSITLSFPCNSLSEYIFKCVFSQLNIIIIALIMTISNYW